jgi:hypothetical protein
MPPAITLTITQGPCKGSTYTFHEPTHCIVGRARGCYPHLGAGPENWTASRFHCLFDIDPPLIRVRDLGSRNGTFVNGNLIGLRGEGQTPEEASHFLFEEHELHDGDEVLIGGTMFRVQVAEAVPEPDRTENLEELEMAVS